MPSLVVMVMILTIARLSCLHRKKVSRPFNVQILVGMLFIAMASSTDTMVAVDTDQELDDLLLPLQPARIVAIYGVNRRLVSYLELIAITM